MRLSHEADRRVDLHYPHHSVPHPLPTSSTAEESSMEKEEQMTASPLQSSVKPDAIRRKLPVLRQARQIPTRRSSRMENDRWTMVICETFFSESLLISSARLSHIFHPFLKKIHTLPSTSVNFFPTFLPLTPSICLSLPPFLPVGIQPDSQARTNAGWPAGSSAIESTATILESALPATASSYWPMPPPRVCR